MIPNSATGSWIAGVAARQVGRELCIEVTDGSAFSPPRQRYMTSVHNAATMHVGVNHPVEEVRPLGSFVSAEVALRITLDFDCDPLVLSSAVGWMPYNDVPESAAPQI